MKLHLKTTYMPAYFVIFRSPWVASLSLPQGILLTFYLSNENLVAGQTKTRSMDCAKPGIESPRPNSMIITSRH
ncbi:hypothetical protein L6452_30684 [Arctium lappa]|uniref:Uncharacterized protein n=1 Tax=Arctium lappa TaxID=4217 RepID=A0ACB8ZJB0_ARCLA|nr:hypothetical protein L6452_30684 [Arctium lappa]